MNEKEFRRQLLSTFEAELSEHIAAITQGLLDLEKGPTAKKRAQLLKELFRAAHSVKGAARAVGLPEIESISHRIEDLFGAIKREECPATPETIDLILSGVDLLEPLMRAHVSGKSFPREDQDRILSQLEAVLSGESAPALKKRRPNRAKDAGRKKMLPKTVTDKVTESVSQKDSMSSVPESQRAPPEKMEKPPAAKPTAKREETIRVSIEKLDALMAGMGELLVAQMRTEQRVGELEQMQELLNGWEKSWRQVRSDYRRMSRKQDQGKTVQPLQRFLSTNENHLKKMGMQMESLTHRFGEDYRHLALLTDELQSSVRLVRMVPIESLFNLLPRMVRDIAREGGKSVHLHIQGADTEIDRQVLEAVKDPLIHLMRNAVDHGIETIQQRAASGKNKTGSLTLTAAHKGNSIVISVSDDGAGIDVQGIKHAIRKRGLKIDPKDPSLGDQSLIDYIFQSGFSTLDRPTILSGRGVGLDVVRKNLEQLHGRVSVDTHAGRGTTFHLFLPLTLATSHVLMMQTAGQTVAVPSYTVDRILYIKNDNIGSVDGKPAVTVDGRVLPLIPMDQALELPRKRVAQRSNENVPVVILGVVEKQLAFSVDTFLSTQNVVVKSLGDQLKQVRNVSGATILGSGQVVILLNVAALMRSGRNVALPMLAAEKGREEKDHKKVLVVDDSITTRTLEKNILENAGFQVLTAADGVEGWEMLQNELFDAVVLDVEMPRMDGFEVTKLVRKSKQLVNLPVLLVTSLESEDHKLRGMEAGADAYITKSSFDQRELLDSIERLIGE